MKKNVTPVPVVRKFKCHRCGTIFHSDEYMNTHKGCSDMCPGCGYSVWQYRTKRSIVRG